MTEYTLFEALRDEHYQLLWLMEQANALYLPEGAALGWALEQIMTAYQQLSQGRISWIEAARAYQAASNAQMECENALWAYFDGW